MLVAILLLIAFIAGAAVMRKLLGGCEDCSETYWD
jgi:hypothetical protein